MKSRRRFLTNSSLGLLSASSACMRSSQTTSDQPPGAPPAFNTAPAVGPEVSPTTFAEAEKLVQVEQKQPERAMAARSWRTSMAYLYERRTGPRKIVLEPTLAPWSNWEAVLPGAEEGPTRTRFIRTEQDPGPVPGREEDIAFAPLTQLSLWIEQRQLTSERLTNIFLERLNRFNPKLRCVITLMREQALAEAKQADREIAAGHHRGPLHGIP
jgi:Amidase